VLAAAAAHDARSLRIRARRDVSTLLAGAYRSAFRGRGLTFEELRDYQPGDDPRWIEWNATARLGRPITKRMREERDLVLALLVDVSPSLAFGQLGASKLEAARRAAGALAAAAAASQDRIALCTFADRPLERLRPAAGPAQLLRVFDALAAAQPGARTDARGALEWAVATLPRHTIVVLLSDLVFPDPGAPLRQCARKHELVVLRLRDPADRLPDRTAPVRVAPSEDGRPGLLRARRSADLAEPGIGEPGLLRLGAEVGALWTGARLVPSLQRFFEQRVRRAG
jgi:uncharacterized protein (DUF58 family)